MRSERTVKDILPRLHGCGLVDYEPTRVAKNRMGEDIDQRRLNKQLGDHWQCMPYRLAVARINEALPKLGKAKTG